MKITKSQLRQMIKEEVQKELDEGLLDFLTGKGLTANQQRAVDNRTKEIMADQPNQSEKDAMKQAKYELENGMLDDMGKLKGPEKSSPEERPKLRQRSVAAGTKKPERYYDHKSKGFKVR
tara:strand:- start:600 stop:959 length:360 start_codon:yes stop_codon:yes gene_type:complete